MKRFFSTLLSAILLVTSTLTAVAFSLPDYDADHLTPIECSITLDGKTLPCEPGYADNYDTYYRYTSIADALGFETTFSAETGRIESTYEDGSCISFGTTGTDAMITYPDGSVDDFFLYYALVNIDGRMYISKYGIDDLLQDKTEKRIYFDGEKDSHFYIYTEAGINSMIRSVNKELSVLNQIQSTISNQDYTSSGTTKLTINLGSDFFGIKGSGDSVVTVTSAKRGEKMYWKIESTGNGLVNLFKLLENIYDIDAEKFPSSESLECFFDGNKFYLKDPTRIKSMLEYEYYDFTDEFPEETNAVLNEWAYTEEMQEAWSEYLLYSSDLGTFIVNYAFDMSYDESPQEMIDMLLALLSDKNFSVNSSLSGKTYTYKLDKAAFLEALAPTMSVMSKEERAEFEKTMSVFDINLTTKQKIKDSGSTSTSSFEISLSNIPNPWNEEVFSLDISAESSQTYSFTKAKTFTFPDVSNAVNIIEYVENVLIEHEIYYDDDYYDDDYEDYE